MRTQPLQRKHSGNRKNRCLLGVGTISCSLALLGISGCTTYVDSPPPRTVYVSPLPPPPLPPPPAAPPANETVYVAPPAVMPMSADASPEVIRTDSDFYQPLSPYGEWVVVGSYGRCWRPARVDTGWRPYANGHWEMTDAGWYWVSDEPWAWATYHYGRWDWNAQFGWFWVPQTQWAPAWVAWREGGGYVGWAPLPPSAMIAVSGSIQIHDAAFAPRSFVFVQEKHLLEPVRPATVVVNNTTIINKTVNITKIRVVNKTVVNDGPKADIVERESGRRLTAVAARELRHQEETTAVARHRQFQANEELKTRAPSTPAGSRPSQGTVTHTPSPPNRTLVTPDQTRPPASPGRPIEVREATPVVPATRVPPQRTPRQEAPVRVESPKPKPEPAPVARRPEVKQEQTPAPLPRVTVPLTRPAEPQRPKQPAESPARIRPSAETPVAAPTARPEPTRSPRNSNQPEVRTEVQKPKQPAAAGPTLRRLCPAKRAAIEISQGQSRRASNRDPEERSGPRQPGQPGYKSPAGDGFACPVSPRNLHGGPQADRAQIATLFL